MSVSLFDYEILQKENAKLRAEVERLKEQTDFANQCAIDNNTAKMSAERETEKLQLLVESYRSKLLIAVDALKKYQNTKVPTGGDLSTGQCHGFAMMALTEINLAALGESEK